MGLFGFLCFGFGQEQSESGKYGQFPGRHEFDDKWLELALFPLDGANLGH